jgi:Mn-containing catalase
MNRQMSAIRSEEINLAAPIGEQQWNEPVTEKGDGEAANTKRKTKSAKSGKTNKSGL